MLGERKVLREESAELARQLREAIRSGADGVSVEWAGRPMVLERVSEVEYLMRPAADVPASRVILGSESRPAGYPTDLPYVPHEVVSLDESGTRLGAAWWSTGDLAALLAEIERQCVAEGWVKLEDPPVPDAGVTRHVFRKAGVLRHLMLSQGIIGLAHSSADFDASGRARRNVADPNGD